MKPNYKKIVLSSVLITLACLIVLFAIFSLVMFFFFTKNMAQFFYGLGSYDISASLYFRVYEKNDDIYYCYQALNMKIMTDDEKRVIKYFEEFESDEEYADFISKINSNNLNSKGTILLKSSILNEENYLYSRYISALVDVGEYDKAFKIAVEKFKDYESFTFESQGIYVLNYLVAENSMDKFTSVQTGYDMSLVDSMQAYFQNCSALVESKKDSNKDIDKCYLIALANRMVIVGQNINTIYSHLEEKNDLIESNLSVMQNVNDIIKGVL